MEARVYRNLLVRLLVFPVAALGLLVLVLGYELQRVERSASAVDHSDQIIAHANQLIKLMIDEETGLRGFLLTHNPIFLQPFHQADRLIEPEFVTLFSLVHGDVQQSARLQRWQTMHQAWEQDAKALIAGPAPVDLNGYMVQRKEHMDGLRAQAEDFRATEEIRRASRSSDALQVKRQSVAGVVVLAAILATLLTVETRRLFNNLNHAYSRRLEEAQQKAEESYAREQWLNTTIRSIGDAVIACDPEGKIVFMNGVAEQLTGWKEADAHGVPLSKVFFILNEYTRAVVESPVDKVRRLGTVVGLANHTILVSKNGNEICIDDSAAPIRDSSSHLIGIVLVFRDNTQRRISERALMQAEKLATAGRLATSIAHEINNPLEGLVNLVYIARISDDLEEVRSLLTEADRELQRISHITRQSLGFYRESSVPVSFRPDVVIEQVIAFYSSRAALLGVSLRVKVETEMEVFGTPGELRQVLSNLIANSLDACPKGGVVFVAIRSTGKAGDRSPHGVRITVADTGCGIPREHMENIFEPFFTTKETTGTGLGLWVSRQLIEKNGGRIRVRSRVHQSSSGTVFSLYLPKIATLAPG